MVGFDQVVTTLSVIIPTRNRADLLNGALKSLELQTLPRDSFEVLVIDNGSTDNTKAVVESARQVLGNVRYLYDDKPGLHVGRHLGMKMAKSDILVYADDDIEAYPTWLEAIEESFHDQEVALVGGKIMPKFETAPPNWIERMWEPNRQGTRNIGYLSIIDLGEVIKATDPYNVYGCNFSIRKSILLEAGGFHPDAMPKELLLYRGDGETHVSKFIAEKGYKSLFHHRASVYHMVPAHRMTENYFCLRAYNQGISDSYTFMREKIKKNKPTTINLKFDLKKVIRFFAKYINNDKRRRYNFYLAYQAGYEFHRYNVMNDQRLYDWVTKDYYM